jgi:GT2 family glycosyltransferase
MGSTPGDHVEISVVISTYNRGYDLRETLESLCAQCTDVSFEALVVDNNSTDDTRAVIESYASTSGGRIRYLFERQQGVSFGRNLGVQAARGEIIAFTDDDVILAPDWVENIKRALDTNPDVDYLTGKIHPLFAAPPPAWLTFSNSGPCTIRDRGDTPIFGQRGRFFPGWATANMAIRRAVLTRVGLFATDFSRGEDLELIIRVWRAGGRGMYAPDVVVTHKIPKERTTKAYHRMWHMREGEIRARVRYFEVFDGDGRPVGVPRKQVFGVPLFLLGQLLQATVSWCRSVIGRDEAAAFHDESRWRQTYSYLRARARQRAARE